MILITAAIGGTLAIVVLYGILTAVISLLINASMSISEAIMSESLTCFSEGENILLRFAQYLPFNGESMTVSLSSVIDAFSYGLMLLILVISIIRYIQSPLTGDKADPPWTVVARMAVAVFLKSLIFGTGLSFTGWAEDGLLGEIGKVMGTVLSSLTFSREKFQLIDASMLDIHQQYYIAAVILSASLITAVILAGVSYIERVLTFALSVLIGPIAVTLYAFRDTAHIAKEWILSIFVQFGAIFVQLLMWGAFYNQMATLSKDWTEAFTLGNNADTVFKLAVAVGILSLVKNSEKIFCIFGIHTMPSTESAQMVAGGIGSVWRNAMLATQTIPAIQKGAASVAKGSVPAMGGKQRTPNGITNISDFKGDMGVSSVKNAPSKVARGLMGDFGIGSMGSAKNQSKAAKAVGNAIKGAKNGERIQSLTVGGKEISGVEALNTAISGNPSDLFCADKTGTAAIKKAGAILPDHSKISGAVCDYYNPDNGKSGKMFVPTEKMDQTIPSGTRLDMGGGNIGIIGQGYSITGSGNRGYEVSETAHARFAGANNSYDNFHLGGKAVTTGDDGVSRTGDIGIAVNRSGVNVNTFTPDIQTSAPLVPGQIVTGKQDGREYIVGENYQNGTYGIFDREQALGGKTGTYFEDAEYKGHGNIVKDGETIDVSLMSVLDGGVEHPYAVVSSEYGLSEKETVTNEFTGEKFTVEGTEESFDGDRLAFRLSPNEETKEEKSKPVEESREEEETKSPKNVFSGTLVDLTKEEEWDEP